ncbi:hypothetical protein MY04_4503 [Flammeovirga sp. MY04]|uniref:hypothetical protein n=1 Tax=Flammeovirga sp. MY04 TaxID=1191459 RepID=UPI0008060BA9|nr:hypothetical protein [Flammeovirga sp. MY04]ANQ51838.1 hypothetical protein MY04_4503 [Flammeovirga sp. MY04]
MENQDNNKDYNVVLYEKLYSKIATALGVTTPMGELKLGESLLSVYNPGQYIPVGLDPESKPADNQEISQIFDTSTEFNTTYSPVALSVSNAYKSILDYKVFPLADLSEKEKEKLQGAIESYNSLKEKCDEAMYAYLDAEDAYNEAWATYENDKIPANKPKASLKAKKEAAMQNWIVAGKVQQETNVAIISQYQGREGAAFWEKLDRIYEDNQGKLDNGMGFCPVIMAPSYKSWHKEEGWTKFEFNQKDLDNQSNSRSITAAGNLSFDYGIISISGEGSYKEDKGYTKINETNLVFKCELMRVTLTRPWMNPLLFNSEAWKFSESAPAAEYSTGGSIVEGIRPTGAFVTFPTTYILARNVEIIGQFTNTVEETLKRNVEASATVGIGPFSISGRVSYGEEDHKIQGTIAGNKIEIKDTQIIAAISQVLPKLPNPNPNLPWS